VNTLDERIDGVLHEPTQVHDRGVDLSVAGVYRIAEPGRVDFGGGELTDATRSPVETALRNPDDDYGWWHLDEGQYLIEYNESLTGDGPVVVRTREAVLERGAFHPTLRVESFGSVPLSVGGGLRLKENARVSTATAGLDGPD